MTKNINLPMELINKILLYRPSHPTALIVKSIFNNFNRMENHMFENFGHEPKEFDWNHYKIGYPSFRMYMDYY